jgi:hypothetical protein
MDSDDEFGEVFVAPAEAGASPRPLRPPVANGSEPRTAAVRIKRGEEVVTVMGGVRRQA